MKKTLIIGLVLIVAIATGYFAWTKKSDKASAGTQPAATLKASKGPFRVVISSTGSVVSKQDVDIKCKASGTVVFLPYDVSDRVKKEDVLLKLDTLDQERTVKKAEAVVDADKATLAQARQELVVAELNVKTARMKADANLATAVASAKEAKAKFARQSELLKAKLASQEDYDTAEKTAAVAEADVLTARAGVEDIKAQEESLETKRQAIKQQEAMLVQDEANLDLQRQQLEYATVYAPFDGVVASLTNNSVTTRIGSLVQSGQSNVSGGTTVMTLSDLSQIFSYATVDESDIGRVIDPQHTEDRQSQRVRITADAYPNIEFEGKVVRVATKGVSSSNVVTFEVRVEVTSQNKDLLKPQMTTNNEIIVLDNPNAVTVPQNTVMTRHGETFVSIVKDDGTKERRAVKLGVTDGYQYEILSGLNGDEQLEALRSGSESRWRGGQQQNNQRNNNRPMMMPR